ncbi:GTPase Obg [Acrasis kona]|uniref:GTPase Obg n=1 Tax=Acrasis kona TaxID=1008807 RepID=A0AAW2Z438_9EUKA
MKATYPERLSAWPAHMKGREITLYIYQHYTSQDTTKVVHYRKMPSKKKFPVLSTSKRNAVDQNLFQSFDLSIEDEHPWVFYREFIRNAESILAENKIRSNGCAAGDRWLGGKYSSLRNETFVTVDDKSIYPPNQCGYNGCKYVDNVFNRIKKWNSPLTKRKDKKKILKLI